MNPELLKEHMYLFVALGCRWKGVEVGWLLSEVSEGGKRWLLQHAV